MTITKRANAPLACGHCKRIWYGMWPSGNDSQYFIPEGVMLCTNCWDKLELHLNIYADKTVSHVFVVLETSLQGTLSDTEKEANLAILHEEARKWIADPTKKPTPSKNPYDKSVPYWMRDAVNKGLVEPNSHKVYKIEHTGKEALSVEEIEHDPRRGRR